MFETYTFADSPAGLEMALKRTRSLRRAGFKTRLLTVTLYGFTVHTLVAFDAPARPTRKERGCYVNR